jgi:CheY-like chemotaxis protein
VDDHNETASGQAPVPLRALVVDDEPPLVRLVTSYLERDGFQVQAAGDGEQAVELAKTFKPEVIVLDLMLPRMDGIEACRQMRTFSDAYIVMLTARAEEVDKLVGLSIGADDYLTKPSPPANSSPGSARCCAAPEQPPHRRARRASAPPRRADHRPGRPRGPPRRPAGRADPPGVRPARRPLRAPPGGAGPPPAPGAGSGGRTGTATSTWSTSTSPTCAANSATTPAHPAGFSPCAGSATAWDPAHERPRGMAAGQSRRQAAAGPDAGGRRRQPDAGGGRPGGGARVFHTHVRMALGTIPRRSPATWTRASPGQ